MPFHKAKVPLSARQRKLRDREKRRKARETQPPAAAQALQRAMAWQVEIDGGLCRADIARREGVSRARVTQIMSLLTLREDLKGMLLSGHGTVEGWSIRRALSEVR